MKVRFDNQTKISSFKAWTITPDGHEIEVKEKDATENGLSTDEVFSDEREKVLAFPEANPGSVVGYEVVQKQRPRCSRTIGTSRKPCPSIARFTLQLPPGWEFSVLGKPSQQKPQVTGKINVWEVMDIPAIEVEPEMPPWNSSAAASG